MGSTTWKTLSVWRLTIQKNKDNGSQWAHHPPSFVDDDEGSRPDADAKEIDRDRARQLLWFMSMAAEGI